MNWLKFSWLLAGVAILLATAQPSRAQNIAMDSQPLSFSAASLEAAAAPVRLPDTAGNTGIALERAPDGRLLIDQETLARMVDEQMQHREQLAREEEVRRKQEAAALGYEVGSDLSLKTNFKDGLFPWFETPNKDFTMHPGAWFQWDNMWFDQSDGLRAPRGRFAGPEEGIASGAPLGGIGNLQDGVMFRRIRPNIEGTFWETGEYRLITAFENSTFDTAGVDEMWVGMKSIPVIGTIRAGHVKNAMGMEANMIASSRAMTFIERSAYSESIELAQNFVTGIWINNSYFDQRAAWTVVLFRPDVGASTDAFFGDGQSGLQGRITGLPLYENDGRQLLHLGLSGGCRTGTNNLAVSSIHTVQLRTRNELRDDVAAGGMINGNTNRIIDTGIIASDSQVLAGLEALLIDGPLSIQSEFGWCFVNHVIGFAPVGQTLHPALDSPQSYVFNGGYLQVAYTLTGETRAYDKNIGTQARAYFGKSGPYNKAWIARDEEGHLMPSFGAWEIAARYTYVDLNNGVDADRIQGGMLHGSTVGINWYLNNNCNVIFDWIHEYRYNMPTGSVPGHVDGFGTRVQFQF